MGRGKLSLPLRWGIPQLAWLVPGFCGDIKAEGHGEFPNAHLPCTDCEENWPFLVLPLMLWFWGENVSGLPAVSVPRSCALVEVKERGWFSAWLPCSGT